MNVRGLLLRLTVLLAVTASAAAAFPELELRIAKYREETGLLKQQQEAQGKAIKERYLAALASAETAATTEGKPADVQAIMAERAAMEEQTMAPNNPALPRKVHGARSSYLSGVQQLGRSFQPRFEAATASFLRDVAVFQAKANREKDVELLKAVTEAKALALAENAAAQISGTGKGKSLLINGDFEQVMGGEVPRAKGWNYVNPDVVKLIAETGNQYLRIDTTAGSHGAGFNQKIAVPEKVRSVRITLRYRTHDLKLLEDAKGNSARPDSVVWVRDQNGKNVAGSYVLRVNKDTPGWTKASFTQLIPVDGVEVDLSFGMGGSQGMLDVDDVEIVPQR
jgi:hypothetical protein